MSMQVKVFLAVFIMTLILGPLLIPILRRLKFGQTVRDDGPSSHLVKTGTPTMGGLIFLIPILVVGLLYAWYDQRMLAPVLATLGFGLVGFLDDFIKVVKKRKDGLFPKQKMAGLLLFAVAFSLYTVEAGLGSDIVIPFLGADVTFDLGWFFIPFSILVLLAVSNAVNMTDGLDGLASGVTFFVSIFFALVAMTVAEYEYLKIFSVAVAAGCLGFLFFNLHPAKLFMGDTGSLALGGALGALAILMKLPLMLLIVGIVYVLETLSVILQVASFRLRGKRIFKMAPLHHHFELSGWKETKVVYTFWAVTVGMVVLGLLALRIHF